LDVIYSMRNIEKFKVIVDIDDNIWNTPIGNATFTDGKLQAQKIVALTESVKSADYVTVSTEPLKEMLSPVNDNVVVLPNFINPEEWKFERKKHDKLRIGWVWSPTHFPDMQIIQKPLEKILKKYPVEMVMFGTEKNVFSFDTTNIKGVKYTEYPKAFMEEGIDISIAPLSDNDFNKAKSNIKWLESSLAGACFVGSRVYPYQKSVKQGKTGFLCNKEASWVNTLSKLIENPSLIQEVAKNAKEQVIKNYSSNKEWENFYASIK
ncbi:MAG: glycosyltransferase family 1 protein, partial [Actinobacteria bacterium]|nr:glycosyltransferase family 1 protein [Actinomycetota bacterium]